LWYSARTNFKDMAITKNAKRGVRVSERKRVVNDKLRRTLKEAVKTVRKDVIAKDKKAITTDLSLAFKALDKAAKRGTIKKGTANRKKSRLAKAVAKLDTKTK
jgi:small subunit ribosomal protein S20